MSTIFLCENGWWINDDDDGGDDDDGDDQDNGKANIKLEFFSTL